MRSILFAPTLLLGVLSVTTPLAAQTPVCWDSNLGSALSLGDDDLAIGLTLPFQFPLPGGGTTSSIDVCSNGFVWLVSGSTTSADYTPSVAELLADPPRIAAVWTDLDPSSGGSVHFRATASAAVITWDRVPEYFSSGDTSVQLQLFPGGDFMVGVRSFDEFGGHTVLLGVSAGNGAQDPGEADLSTPPALSNGLPTLYELFTSSEPRDVVRTGTWFIPDGSGGYLGVPGCYFANYHRYGRGCPTPPVFYEEFDSGNACDLAGTSYRLSHQPNGGYRVTRCTTSCFDATFTNNLMLGDDQLATGLQLGFPFPVPGSSVGTTSTIDVDSNGWIGLISGRFTQSSYTETVGSLLSDPERLAVLWDDLNPSSSGAVYADARPGRFVVTWDNVPEFRSSGSNTVQAQLFANGDIVLHYAAGNTATDALVGYSPGNGVNDPGPIDFTGAVPFSSGAGGRPVEHDLAAGSTPRLGATLTLELTSLPSGALAAFTNFGFVPQSVDLAPIGMPSCTLLTSIDAVLPMPLGGGRANNTFRIPNDQSLMNGRMYTQGIVVAPGINAVGIVMSNALELTIGA